MSLTDDWKNDRLQPARYWIKNSRGGIIPDVYMANREWLYSRNECVEEVLDMCDYDHFVELTEKVNTLSSENRQLVNLAIFYADRGNYEEREFRTPHCHSWWDDCLVKMDAGAKAREVLNNTKTIPLIGSLYKGGIYIGNYNGRDIIMAPEDEEEELTFDDAIKLKGRRPLSILEWHLYLENKKIIDAALEKHGKPLRDRFYWSSSEYGYNYYAWVVYPSDGDMGDSNKNDAYQVRCVLAL